MTIKQVENTTELFIIGAGVAGLAAAYVSGEKAILVEKESRPGGLVRTENIDGYWFDRVLHLLHIQENSIHEKLMSVPNLFLHPTPPRAYIHTKAGVTKYPIQLHLNGLDVEVVIEVLTEIAKLNYGAQRHSDKGNYKDFLSDTFGQTLCELFYFPYNRKMWCRSLESLSSDNFTWNIHRPDYATLLRGAISSTIEQKTYNSNSFYPIPSKDSTVRGMEVLSQGLAAQVQNLRLNHEVTEIDPIKKQASIKHKNEQTKVSWKHKCICSLPLPKTINICKGVPEKLKHEVNQLKYNNVYSLALRVKGPRPSMGHWRYYAEESICFTRLIFLHEFDPDLAPAEGWPLLMEIPKPSGWVPEDMDQFIAKAIEDAKSVGAINQSHTVLGVDIFIIDPAYVIFEPGHYEIAQSALKWLEKNDIMMLGRYGRWEYSSMHSVISDGMKLADKLFKEIP